MAITGRVILKDQPKSGHIASYIRLFQEVDAALVLLESGRALIIY